MERGEKARERERERQRERERERERERQNLCSVSSRLDVTYKEVQI
jgi:hypothetical protein